MRTRLFCISLLVPGSRTILFCASIWIFLVAESILVAFWPGLFCAFQLYPKGKKKAHKSKRSVFFFFGFDRVTTWRSMRAALELIQEVHEYYLLRTSWINISSYYSPKNKPVQAWSCSAACRQKGNSKRYQSDDDI